MPKKRKATLPLPGAEFDLFAQQVEQALEHFAQSEWLGLRSPLTAPYFLGQEFAPAERGDAPQQRGEALQRMLVQASEQLDGELQALLRVVYFKRNSQLDNVGLAMALHMADRTFYRTRIKAIQALAHTLNHTLLPPLRLGSPMGRTMVGRTTVLGTALATLQAGRSVYISGPSGIGKTTLGTAIVRHWLAAQHADNQPPQTTTAWPIFWYTLRGSFNDQLASLLFAFGYFLRNLGAGYTWRQLVADRGIADPERILGLLRYDLDSLQPSQPLICIDELDALQEQVSEHVQILHLLEEVCPLCPTLLIGQRVLLETDEQIQLAGIDHLELDHLLTHTDAPPLGDELRQQLLSYTRGNPALIVLFAALIRNGDDAEEALHMLAKVPSVEALFNRMWRRLTQTERHLLMQLAVFRNPAPQDAWQEQSLMLDQLHQREVVQFDKFGGVQLLSHLQRMAYDRIPAEQKPLLHLQAGHIRESRSEYVAAMYHMIEGRQPAHAVWVWFVHRDSEMDHGRGAMALNLLNQISPADLPDERDRTALRVARAELLQLAGKPEEAEQELSFVITPSKGVLRAYTHRLKGYAQEMQGRVEQALEQYRESLDSLLGMHALHEVAVRNRLSFLHLYRQHDSERARREALLARAKAEAFLGDVEAMAGHYADAHALYTSALKVIEHLGNDLVALSRLYSYIGVLNVKQGNLDIALEYIEKAIECDRKLGDQVSPLYDMLNLAEIHKLAGRYEKAYQQAYSGLQQAEQLKHSYLIAGLAAGVSEACYGLERWDEAEHYATYSLSQEEEFFRASALVMLGLLCHKQGKYEEGVKLLAAALDNTRHIEDRYTEAYVWRSLGHVYCQEGFWEEARAAFETGLQLYTELGLTKEVNEVQKQLRQLQQS